MQTNVIDEAKINEIRSGVDIVEIVSNYIPLTTRGKNFFGICPFHSDHSPSMSVSKEKQIYTCFSCGASGNVFNFLMDYENIGFVESVKICADKAGIPLTITRNITNDKNQELYDIYELTQKLYINNINTNYGIEAKQYLEDRKINSECIKEFGIGLSLPKKDLLTNLLISKKHDPKVIEKTGLILKKQHGYIDTYINRIMFPLFDLTGKIVGYSGRIYNSESNSKYFNTRETDIFKKGEILYNYHRAKESVRKLNKLIVVEGFMDVIRMYTVGIKNVVAIMGTAVTKQQALLMKRLSEEIIICFDGDQAGRDATNSCINELAKIGVAPKIIKLENNLDPDDFILKHGKDKFIEKLENPINSMEYKMKYLKKDLDLSNNFEMAKYVDSVLLELSKINNDTYIELSLKKLSSESNLSIEYLKNKIIKGDNTNIKKVITNPYKENTNKVDKYLIVEQQLVYYMLNDKEVVKKYIKEQPIIENESLRKLAREVCLIYKEKQKINLADMLTHFESTDFEIVIKKLMMLKINDKFDYKKIDEFIRTLKERTIKQKIKQLQDQIKKEEDPIKKAEYGNEIVKLKQMEEEYDK